MDDVLAHASHSEKLDCAAEVDDDFASNVFGVFCSDVSFFLFGRACYGRHDNFGDHLL